MDICRFCKNNYDCIKEYLPDTKIEQPEDCKEYKASPAKILNYIIENKLKKTN